MPFDALDAQALRKLDFTVGINSAIRLQKSITYIISDDGSWYASHFMNNIRLKGKESNPVRAYLTAKKTLQHAIMYSRGEHGKE